MTFYIKSILSIFLALSAFVAIFSMLELMGRKEKRFTPKSLKTVHKANGIFFILLALVLSYYCLKIMRGAGLELSPRAVLHSLLATAVFLVLFLKLTIVRFYRQYYSMAVSLGMVAVLLTLGTVASSAGYYFTMKGGGTEGLVSESSEELVNEGAVVFKKYCADCHYANKTNSKIGPGLKGLALLEKLPSSGRPPTGENIRRQLAEPFAAMPSFTKFTEEELKSLVAFLKSI
jgi:mono/diheme cytochrome c family protein